jgi:predicted O-methyltransferase YrrM
MKLKQILRIITPDFVKLKIHSLRQKKELDKINSFAKVDCITNNLKPASDISLAEIFNSKEITGLWNQSKDEIDNYKFIDGRGGVNPGDRRALYYLISKFKPSSVLEIGTHIGASTIHIASALSKYKDSNNQNVHLSTLDIRDVNSAVDKPWLDFESKFSPGEMINQLNYGDFVTFITDTSINFLENTTQKFDLIFLDGDHSSHSVYHEIPLALKLLNENGVIILHDYFPNGKPLWSDGRALLGPYLATKRFIDEGVNFVILPLGKLPWSTKLNSNVTSLALMAGKN